MSALVNIVSHIHYVSISACGRRRARCSGLDCTATTCFAVLHPSPTSLCPEKKKRGLGRVPRARAGHASSASTPGREHHGWPCFRILSGLSRCRWWLTFEHSGLQTCTARLQTRVISWYGLRSLLAAAGVWCARPKHVLTCGRLPRRGTLVPRPRESGKRARRGQSSMVPFMVCAHW